MNPWLRSLARLGLAGACVLAVGCGSDVPDTSTEGQPAAAGSAPASDNAGPAEAPKTEVASTETAPSAPKAEEATPAEPSTPPAEAAAQPPAKKAGGSTTAEMYALATTPPASSNPAASGAAPSAPPGGPSAAPGAPGPGQMGGMPSGMAAMMQGQGRMGPGAPGMSGPVGAAPGASGPGGPGGANPGMMAMMGQMRPGMAPGSGGMNPSDMAKMMGTRMGGPGSGMPGAPGGNPGATPGGAGASGAAGGTATAEPVNLRSPDGAVRAFLNALKAKDLDSLNEAMAAHAPVEAASAKTREIFQKIFDLNLPDADLDEISKKLEGYQIIGENPPKSTGRLDVVIQKQADGGGIFRRRVTVRREKKGWGVVDISGPSEFKAMNNYGQRRKTR